MRGSQAGSPVEERLAQEPPDEPPLEEPEQQVWSRGPRQEQRALLRLDWSPLPALRPLVLPQASLQPGESPSEHPAWQEPLLGRAYSQGQ